MANSTQPQLFMGSVKQVLSGDTVVIWGKRKTGIPPEKTICLSNIAAPKLARKGPTGAADSVDQPYAWESREFLRRLVLGRPCQFSVETATPTGRNYGILYVKDKDNIINVNNTLVQEGFATVRKESIKSQPDLAALETTAKNAKKGMHAGDGSAHVRTISWNLENPKELFEKNKNKALSAIIEHVRDGSTFRGFILPSFQHFTIMLSGAKSPVFRLDTDGQVDKSNSEKYAEDSKFFVEKKLLQREVTIKVEDYTNTALIGSVSVGKADVAENLLKEGYAKCFDRNMITVSGGASRLRAAEKHAKSKNLGIWETYKAPKLAKKSEISGVVVDIPYGDSLMVLLADKTEMPIHLNNVRAPRQLEDAPKKSQTGQKSRNLYDIPLMFEAREFLRELCMGKKVEAVLEHKVDTKAEANGVKTDIKRNYCMVKVGNVNVAEELVKAGLATVGRTRADDEGRTACYDELLAAELVAKEEGRGVHGKKESLVPMRINEIAGEKSKSYLSQFKRSGTLEALVEYVTSGSRFRCYLSKDQSMITFLLSGINCPRNDKETPLGVKAYKFAKSLVQLRKVELEFESMDKKGNFIGYLHVEGKNLAVKLVEQGLASIHFSAENSKHYNFLRAAEAKAKEKKLGIWENEQNAPVDVAPKQENVPTTRKVAPKSIRVSDVSNTGKFFAQFCSDGADLEKMMDELREALKQSPPAGSYTPSRGQLCAAKFVDNLWYRALVERVNKNEVHILYVDYGNREITKASKLAVLPPKFASKPRYAHEMSLAFAKFPSDEDYFDDALAEFIKMISDKVLNANFEYKTDGVDFYTLKTPEGEDVSKCLIKEGFVLVDRSRKDKRFHDLVKEYEDAQSDAKKKHKNVWQYGDITEDDAFEFGYEKK